MRVIAAALGVLLAPAPANAALVHWTGNLATVEQNAANRAGEADYTFLGFSGAWSAAGCASGIAWFNGRDNANFVAMALSAKLSGRAVRVYVDDALPKYSGTICQIINLRLEP